MKVYIRFLGNHRGKNITDQEKLTCGKISFKKDHNGQRRVDQGDLEEWIFQEKKAAKINRKICNST